MNNTFTDLVLYFMIYSFLGWAIEVLVCSIPAKKFVNRGFLTGPYCPIYGFGAMIILFLPHPFRENPLQLFVFAVISTTILEYVTSWAMEASFGIRWWDYSNHKFNLKGRICLQNSILFGLMGVIVTYLIHPGVTKFVMSMNVQFKQFVVITFLMVILVDLVITIVTLIKLNQRLKNLKSMIKAAEKYNSEYAWFNKWDLNGSFTRLEEICVITGDAQLLETTLKIRGLTLWENPGKRLIAAFPNMKHPDFEQKISAFMTRLKDKNDKEVKEDKEDKSDKE